MCNMLIVSAYFLTNLKFKTLQIDYVCEKITFRGLRKAPDNAMTSR